MKTLIVYYSLGGFTKSIVKKLAQGSGADILALHPVKEYPKEGAKRFVIGGRAALAGEKPKLQPYIFNAEKYGHIVIATPVWASSPTPPIRTFIRDNAEALKGKTVSAIFTQLGNGAQKAEKKLCKALEIERLNRSEVFFEPSKKDPHTENEAKLEKVCGWLKND